MLAVTAMNMIALIESLDGTEARNTRGRKARQWKIELSRDGHSLPYVVCPSKRVEGRGKGVGGWEEGRGVGRGEKHLQSNSSAAAMGRKLGLTCV